METIGGPTNRQTAAKQYVLLFSKGGHKNISFVNVSYFSVFEWKKPASSKLTFFKKYAQIVTFKIALNHVNKSISGKYCISLIYHVSNKYYLQLILNLCTVCSLKVLLLYLGIQRGGSTF